VPEAYIKGSQIYINGIVLAVQEGTFIINPDTKEITHKLKFPIGSGPTEITELKYKARLTVGAIQANTSGISMANVEGKSLGIIASLCGRPRTELAAMDSEDFRPASDVAAFFSQ
jgi:hypothetical protein